MTDTDRPLSERLAFALSTLYAAADLAGQRRPPTGQPACPQPLREAARAYAKVADEADGIADPQIATLTADHAARGGALAAIEHQRRLLAEKVGAADFGWDLVNERIDAMTADRDRLAVKVAELEADRESMSRSHRVDTADSVRVAVSEWKERARNVDERHASASVAWRERDAQWQTATGAATPAGVRRLTEAMVDAAYRRHVPYGGATMTDADHACVRGMFADLRDALTAAGPVVLPGATPTDEEIARALHDLIFPGAKYHAIDAEMWPAAVAKVIRPLLSTQTCPQCGANEIHCAGCGTATSKAWECADCAAGGDAGREDDRLRGAVVEAADRWTDDSDPDAPFYEASAVSLMRAVRSLRAHRAGKPAPVEPAKVERFVARPGTAVYASDLRAPFPTMTDAEDHAVTLNTGSDPGFIWHRPGYASVSSPAYVVDTQPVKPSDAKDLGRVTVGEIVRASCLDENGAHAGRLRSFLTFAIGKVVTP